MATQHKPLDQQVIVITGASSGIGLATALLAAERGAQVAMLARSGDILETYVKALTDAGHTVMAVVADVAWREQVEAAAADVVARFGRIDTWVNNAGLSIYGRLDEVSEEDNRLLFDINFWGAVNGSLVALPHLKRQGGALINIGSEVSEAALPLQGMYVASKHALKGFTDALRLEIEDVDEVPVSVTLIQPTAVDTPFPQHARNYMRQEPKLPEPLINPLDVSEAILKAAVEGGRDVKVGATATLNTMVSKLMPRLGDMLSAKRTFQQQQPESARHPEGTLYEAGHGGRIYGEDAKNRGPEGASHFH